LNFSKLSRGLTRGIEAAVEAGAHLINLGGGRLTDDDEAIGLLDCREFVLDHPAR
jgi:hypothetical protein